MKWPVYLTFPRPPDEIIGGDDDPYMLRWKLIVTPWVRVYLHRFIRSDDDRALHDHPASNLSILLSGQYREIMPGRVALRRPFRPVWRRAEAAHRVELIDGRRVWSLFLRGPTKREWGFHCPQGWRHWSDFSVPTPGGNKVGRGCG
jgi:hypothetical protein